MCNICMLYIYIYIYVCVCVCDMYGINIAHYFTIYFIQTEVAITSCDYIFKMTNIVWNEQAF